MKKYLLSLTLLLLLPCSIRAANTTTPQWMALDPIGTRAEVFDHNLKAKELFKSGPKPYCLQVLPEEPGYALLYLGSETLFKSTKEPGGIIYLDEQLQATKRQLTLPGRVVKQFYHDESCSWFIFTVNDSETYNLTIVDLALDPADKESLQTIALSSAPACYLLQDWNKLAVATSGSFNPGIQPELLILDLATMEQSLYPLSANPGAIFIIDEDRLLVACGGIQPDQSYLSTFFESSDIQQPTGKAALHLIDSWYHTSEVIEVGYAPLVIIQDHQQANTFYLTSSNTTDTTEPRSSVQVLADTQLRTLVEVAAKPNFITQASNGNLMIMGEADLFLVDPFQAKVIRTQHFNLKPDEILLSVDRLTCYLTYVNSNYLEIINLEDGQSLSRIKLGKGSILGSAKLGDLFSKPQPLVITASEQPISDNGASQNHRICMDETSGLIYALSNGAELCIIDSETNQLKQTISYRGSPYGIHLTPDHRWAILATEEYWYLMDPTRTKPFLTISISKDEDHPAPETGYYSPDGKQLLIPFERYIYIIDLTSGKLSEKVRSRSTDPIITWIKDKPEIPSEELPISDTNDTNDITAENH